MSFQLLAGLSGVCSTSDTPGTLLGSVEAVDDPETILGTVDSAAAASYSGDPTYWHYRIKLAGEWIPESDVVGPLRIQRDIYEHSIGFTFGLVGSSYSVMSTQKTWTHTEVEIHTQHGLASQIITTDPYLRGRVLTCSQSDDHGPVLNIQCGDDAVFFEKSTTCREWPPFSGKTRGSMVREVLADAGITDVEVPDGQVIDHPVQANNIRLFQWLKTFIAPEGWVMRFGADGVLRFYKPQLIEFPSYPDEVWWRDDVYSIGITPPSDVASRFIVRGSVAVERDELGVETTTTTTIITAPYAPVVPDQQQAASTGTITPSGLTQPPEEDRVVSKVVDEQSRIGGKLTYQRTTVYGWYNLTHAKYQSQTGPTYYNPVASFIAPDGRYVRWNRERFIEVSRTETTNTYDSNDDLVETKIDTYRWHSPKAGLVSHVGDINVPTNYGQFVWSDDESYSDLNERYGINERQVISYEYDTATGAMSRQTQETYRYYSPQCRTSGATHGGWYKRYSGIGQTAIIAEWSKVETKEVVNTLDSGGSLLGTITSISGYNGPAERVDGAYEWGDLTTDETEEGYRLIEAKSSQYNVISEDQVELVEFSDEGRSSSTVLGGLPVPVFLNSAWTRYQQQPIEIPCDDDTFAAWFGFARKVFNHDHLVSETEAEAFLAEMKRRETARHVRIERPKAQACEGGTVLFVDTSHGLSHRGLVKAIDEVWHDNGEVTATYELEVPL